MTFPPSGAHAPTDATPLRDSGHAPAKEPVLDPAQARLHAKMRRLMMISGFATVLGIAVVIDAGGTVEVRTFDLRSLRPTGRLKFAAEP
jgi:hypothetical protein